jgi:cell division protein FtsL
MRAQEVVTEKSRTPIGRRPSTAGRKTFWVSAGVAGVLVFLGVAHTWTRVAVLERKYQLSRARSENDRLTNELDKLSLEAATYESAAKVDQAARGVLAMAKPPPTNVVVVESDVPAPAVRSTLATNEH